MKSDRIMVLMELVSRYLSHPDTVSIEFQEKVGSRKHGYSYVTNTEVYSWGKDEKYQIQLMSGHHVRSFAVSISP